jgi:hypothetical protein
MADWVPASSSSAISAAPSCHRSGDRDDRQRARRARSEWSGGPFVEGVVIASVQASIGQSLDDVLHAAEEARDLDKGVGR